MESFFKIAFYCLLGTMILLLSLATSVSCSPAAPRETQPVRPVTLLRYPAVNRFKLQQPPPSPLLRRPLLQLKVKVERLCFFNVLFNTLHHRNERIKYWQGQYSTSSRWGWTFLRFKNINENIQIYIFIYLSCLVSFRNSSLMGIKQYILYFNTINI